ncbi:MAG: tRNA 4-thiouridine(8) synthase ThiI [Patescibacteria group bacterium]
MRKVKALVLLSGGLDSMLAVRVLRAQGIEVTGICFTSNFFSCDKAKKAAKILNISLKIKDISKEILKIVKNPSSGYGKHLNPCIDCHSLMIKIAGEIMKKENFNIIATGEVLGERPFSQNKDALAKVEKLAGFGVLRPLSAKLLPETNFEKKGLVKRGRLFNIKGRRREQQFELAEKYKISEFPSPDGGCLLTDPGFNERLIKTLEYWPDCSVNDIELLKYGRVFWLKTEDDGAKVLVIIGRNEKESEMLKKLAIENDIIVEPEEIPGPTSIIRFKNEDLRMKNSEIKLKTITIPKKLNLNTLELDKEKNIEENIRIVSLLTGWYAVKARGKKVKFDIKIIN